VGVASTPPGLPDSPPEILPPRRLQERHPIYNESTFQYNGEYNGEMKSTSHVMTVSRNGQVSIPADTRARWKTNRVLVVDLGDRVVMRPLSDQPVDDLFGKYRGRGPNADRARKQARSEDAARARSR